MSTPPPFPLPGRLFLAPLYIPSKRLFFFAAPSAMQSAQGMATDKVAAGMREVSISSGAGSAAPAARGVQESKNDSAEAVGAAEEGAGGEDDIDENDPLWKVRKKKGLVFFVFLPLVEREKRVPMFFCYCFVLSLCPRLG